MLRALVGVMAIVLLFVGGDALACRCTGPRPGKVAAAHVDVVFVGKIVSVAHLPDRPRWQTSVVIAVERSYKGRLTGDVTIELGLSSCGLSGLVVGETWAMFAKRDDDGALHTRQCIGSQRLAAPGKSPSKAVLKALDQIDVELR